ncbi:FadR/GntR family transcriptional regulator [Paenibacillus sp. MBLB4367]|uniref:FadR/GntR family transcriptional regulator n=1 Tax=Paenibacillus sp. MBLB4367 TaxID=3384767 RepID=UPI0039082662
MTQPMEPTEPLQRNMLSHLASDRIRAYISENGLKPGDKLPTERDLAERLQVSRTVVREALNQLETLGLIFKVQGSGIFIAQPNLTVFFRQLLSGWEGDDQSVGKLLDFRLMLEQAALSEIADRAQDEDYAMLERLIDEAERTDIDPARFLALDAQFHRELLKLTRNDLFYQLVAVVQDYFVAIERNGLQPLGGASQATLQEHRALISLLRNRKLDEARQLLRKHLHLKSK